jgi:hypothetical protein
MSYQRKYLRVPLAGAVILSIGTKVLGKAIAINISAGGVCLSLRSSRLHFEDYQIEIITTSRGVVKFSDLPVYQTEKYTGFKLISIDDKNFEIIKKIVGDFQLTEDFIKHIDQHNILGDWLVDDEGNDLVITFESTEICGMG